MQTYLDKELNKEVNIRYTFTLRPYRANNPKFAMALYFVPSVLLRPEFNTDNYEGLPEVVDELLTIFSDKIHRSVGGSLEITFGKETTDEVLEDYLKKLDTFFASKGIAQCDVVALVCGIPSLEYGQAYLEHTTSLRKKTIIDFLRGVVPDDALARALADIPVSSAQKFNPDKDTDDSYMNSVIRGLQAKAMEHILETMPEGTDPDVKAKFQKLAKVAESLSKVDKLMNEVAQLMKGEELTFESDDKVEPVKEETYSSEDSKEYDNFQTAWI